MPPQPHTPGLAYRLAPALQTAGPAESRAERMLHRSLHFVLPRETDPGRPTAPHHPPQKGLPAPLPLAQPVPHTPRCSGNLPCGSELPSRGPATPQRPARPACPSRCFRNHGRRKYGTGRPPPLKAPADTSPSGKAPETVTAEEQIWGGCEGPGPVSWPRARGQMGLKDIKEAQDPKSRPREPRCLHPLL